MELIPARSSLSALIPRKTPAAPKELLGFLACRDGLDTWEGRVAAEREIQTRLHFYSLMFERDLSTVPVEVIEELRANRGACLALLLNLQREASLAGTIPDLVREIIEQGLDGFPEQSIPFVIQNFLWLLLERHDEEMLEAIEEAESRLALSGEIPRMVKLARIVANFAPHELPSTIHDLIALHSTNAAPDAASIAAHYLLARIYCHLGLPYEEKECYGRWRTSLATVYQKQPSLLAAGCSRTEPQLTRTIIEAHRRWLRLLHAASENKSIDETVAEFETAGYTDDFMEFKNREVRQAGYQCMRVSRDQVADAGAIKQMISHLLTDASQAKACLILRDDSFAEIEKLPRPSSGNPEDALIRGLEAEASQLNLFVEREPIIESPLENRRWILCCELENPTSAIAVGILPTDNKLSICTARAVAFETHLSQDKDRQWIESTARLLGEAFDSQKLAQLRDVLRKITHQETAGRRAAKRIKIS